MHFAYPSRKTSRPPYPVPSPKVPLLCRSRLKLLGAIAFGLLVIVFLFSRSSRRTYSAAVPKPPPGTPPVVVVTVVDDDMTEKHKEYITSNRKAYASLYGYEVFMPNAIDYKVGDSPQSWAKVPALRHATTLFPHTTFFWYLGAESLITNVTLSLEQQVVEQSRLESLMILDVPVVPPDSVIKTYTHINGKNADLIMTQDLEGISQASLILRRGEWAKYFLDVWFDPMYRSYNFQKAEGHALEHLVQWHGTILAKIVLVPMRTMNSYTVQQAVKPNMTYRPGDFVATYIDCMKEGRSCAEEMAPFMKPFMAGKIGHIRFPQR